MRYHPFSRCEASLVELAARVGIIQSLISAVESDERKLSAEMAVRFAQALGVTMDELLGAGRRDKKAQKPNRKVLLRLEQIEALPRTQQTALLRTIDTFLKGAAAR